MHVGMVRLGGEKMSKSLGNLVFVHTLLESHDAAAIRLALLAHHYRESWDFDGAQLENASDRLERWRRSGEGEGALEAVRARLDDDLDTPGAIAAIDEAAAEGVGVSRSAALLGVVL
jgi:L-cysteine:1D-myo-inositol 2-amino-2-deoxy-alpha-D-glucopyranoside ligase